MLATYTCNQTPAEVEARKEAFLARNLFKEAPAYTKETDAKGRKLHPLHPLRTHADGAFLTDKAEIKGLYLKADGLQRLITKLEADPELDLTAKINLRFETEQEFLNDMEIMRYHHVERTAADRKEGAAGTNPTGLVSAAEKEADKLRKELAAFTDVDALKQKLQGLLAVIDKKHADVRKNEEDRRAQQVQKFNDHDAKAFGVKLQKEEEKQAKRKVREEAEAEKLAKKAAKSEKKQAMQMAELLLRLRTMPQLDERLREIASGAADESGHPKDSEEWKKVYDAKLFAEGAEQFKSAARAEGAESEYPEGAAAASSSVSWKPPQVIE